MKNRLTLFLIALLGVLGPGRITDAQPASSSSGGPAPSEHILPPIDAAVPARLETATFALG
jgi:hypothetical protein